MNRVGGSRVGAAVKALVVVLACAAARASAEPCDTADGRVVGLRDDATAPSVILVTRHDDDREDSIDIALWRNGTVEANAGQGSISITRAADIEHHIVALVGGLPLHDDDDDDVRERRLRRPLRPLDDDPAEITIIVRDGSGWRVVIVDSALSTLLSRKHSALGAAVKLLVELRAVANAPLRARSYSLELDALVDVGVSTIPWPSELPTPSGRNVTIGAELLPIVDRLRDRMIAENRPVEVGRVPMALSIAPRIPGQDTINAVIDCVRFVDE